MSKLRAKAKPRSTLPTMPTVEDIEAWSKLTRDQQLDALRSELDHPDCKKVSDASFETLRQEGRTLASRMRRKNG